MGMSSEDAYTPDNTPACPFCDSDETIQVRPDIARCSNPPCRCERFWLDNSNECSGNPDACRDIAQIIGWNKEVVEDMAEVAFGDSADGAGDGE